MTMNSKIDYDSVLQGLNIKIQHLDAKLSAIMTNMNAQTQQQLDTTDKAVAELAELVSILSEKEMD